VTRVVYVCSPWRALDDVTRRANRDRAERACRDIAMAGDVPVAAHLLYPQFLDDADHVERGVGLRCALTLLARCDEVVVYGPPTEGMLREIAAGESLGLPVRHVPLPDVGRG
jgi:hypothetical protein